MKKKFLLLFMSLCLTAAGLTGCGGDDEDSEEMSYVDSDENEDEDDEEDEDDADEDDADDEDTETADADSDEDSSAASTEKTADVSASDDNRGDTWSIFLYLCGTDLESDQGSASVNLDEIISADMSDKINFVIETGGTEEWEFEDMDIPTDSLSRYEVKDGELELVDTQELASMAEEETFADFTKWGVENYPADKYMVILWDHGGGSADGVVWDELFDDEQSLSVKEVAEGIEAAGQTFEVVGFDACLMSTLENASALCPYARYLIGSEETEPGDGWDYTAWLNYLSEDTTMTGDILGIEIVDSFYDKCEITDEADSCTLAVTDLSKIPALVESFNKMAGEMKGYTDDIASIKVITGAFKKAENYGGNTDSEGYTDMVDLGDLILDAQGVMSETGEKVIDDLTSAVVYHKAGVNRSKGEGLSVFVPLDNDEEHFDKYAEGAAISADYLKFLEELYDYDAPENVDIIVPVAAEGASDTENISSEKVDMDSVADAPTISYRDQKIKYNLKVNDDGYLEADVTEGSDIIDEVKCNLYYYDEDDDMYYDLGSDYNVDANDDWTEFTDNFNNTWIFINGNLAMMNASNITDEYIEYSVPILLNDEKTNLKMVYTYDTGKYEIKGIWDGIGSNGQASRSKKQLKDGDRIDFIFKGRSDENSSEEECYYEGFTVSGPITVEEDDLGDGLYAYSMEFDDVFGNSTETRWATITVDDGEVEVTLD